MTIDHFTKQDFEAYLKTTFGSFEYSGLVHNEETYVLALDNQVSITIRSSIKGDGLSADVGQDSIRAWLVQDSLPLGSKVNKWTTRVPNWQERLTKNIKQLMLWRGIAGDCPDCGKPKGIFKVKKNNENKGRPFAICKEHNHFVWLDKPTETKSIYFSRESGESEKHRFESVSSAMGVLAQDKKESASDNLQCANTNPVNNGAKQPDLKTVSKVQPNEAQQKAIEADIKANVRVLAGPGSGKTFVIEHRYAYLVKSGVEPQNILVCTFSKAMADEMGKRIQRTCPEAILEQISTIHAFCYRILTRWYSDSPYYRWQVPKDWQVKKTLDDIIATIWKGEEKPNANEALHWINSSKHFGLDIDQSYDYFIKALGSTYGVWLYEIRSRFDGWLNRNQLLTFTDMLYQAERLIKSDPVWRTGLQQRFSHIIVDEAQDTNYQAMRILATISLEPGQNTIYGRK